MRTGIVKDPRYLEHWMGEYHPESPKRLEVIYRLIDEDPALRSLPLVEPRLATEEELASIHTPVYIESIRETAKRPRVYLDPDTSTCPRSYEVARLAVGGLLEAADRIMEGNLSNGFALVRPPGHHAEASQAKGFCLFNNIAIAAEHLIRKHGLRRVLVVDWDLHHGNGTQHAFYDRDDVFYFSVHQFPHYPGTGYWNEIGRGKGEGYTLNVPLAPGKTDEDYLFIFSRLLSPVAQAFKPEFILVSAGFDIFAGDPLGGMRVTAAGFSGLTQILIDLARTLAQNRLLLTLEGGYHLSGLAEGVKNVLLTLKGNARPAIPPAEVASLTRKELKPIFVVVKKFWPVD
ncbi:MAG: histone deacetylase family protein [Candidatus Aminicenantales bacterium]